MVKKSWLIILVLVGVFLIGKNQVFATEEGYVDCGDWDAVEQQCINCDYNAATCEVGCGTNCDCGSNCPGGECIPNWPDCETDCDYPGGWREDGCGNSGWCDATEDCIPECTPNWQNQECGGWTCSSEQMYQIDVNCTADRCVDDGSCLPPTCSMISGEPKPWINQSYDYTATGVAGGGNLTGLRLWETVTSGEAWHELIYPDPGTFCTTSSCTASWSWDVLGYKYVVCNAHNDTLPENAVNSRCTGNPFKTVFDTWSDCDVADSDQMTVAVVDNKTCTVTLDDASIDPGGSVTVTYSGKVNGPESDEVRVWVEKQDGSEISIPPTVGGEAIVPMVWGGVYYYQAGSCDILTPYVDSCLNKTKTITFPEVGDYYIHCDVPSDPRKCSGNPFCSYETESPSAPISNDCGANGWVSCSVSSDNAFLEVVAPISTADIKADGSDIDITITEPDSFLLSWTSTNATWCTLSLDTVDVPDMTLNGSETVNFYPRTDAYEFELICGNAWNSATDNIGVIVDCGALTAGVDANGEPGDITTSYDYTINWNSTFANSCTLERNTVDLGIESNNSSKAELAEANGDYIYDLVCTNTCSETASDSVTVTVDLCGNTICEAFENCLDCPEDCGECPKAWWQVWGGNLFAGLTSSSAIVSDIPSDITCIEPACTPGLSVLDRASITDSDGFPVTGGGAIEANGEMVTYRDPYVYVIGSAQTRFYENYDYFYSKYSLGLSPPDDFTGSEGDAQKPIYDPDKVAYFRSGDLTIQSAWAVADGESYVVFIDGNLIIDDFSTVGELITVAEGGFLAFIVSGDINITESVGYSVLTNTAGNIEGIYIADGVLSVATNGVADKRFVGEGTFVGWEDVSILRDYDVVLGENNESYPAETFIYRPDFMKNTPEKMKRAQMLWQETN